jgi:hypothetical protein
MSLIGFIVKLPSCELRSISSISMAVLPAGNGMPAEGGSVSFLSLHLSTYICTCQPLSRVRLPSVARCSQRLNKLVPPAPNLRVHPNKWNNSWNGSKYSVEIKYAHDLGFCIKF